MATRCFGRARLTGAAALPLLLSLRRAVGLAATLRADDFFCAVFLVAVRDLAAAREAGFFVFLLAIPALPSLRKAKPITFARALQRSALGLLAKTKLSATGTHHRQRAVQRA